MFKKGFVLLAISLTLLLFALAILPVQAGGNQVVEIVNGHTRMTVPLSVFDPNLEGDAVMRRLNYHMNKRVDGTVTGQYDYELAVQGVVDTVSGHIICFKAEDNRAWIGATVDESSDPDVIGLFSWWQVADNSGSGQADRTTFLGFGSLEATLDYCEGPAPNFIFDIDEGNVLVQVLN
jgi:hypothetical protein